MRRFLLFAFAAFLISGNVSGQIVINELMATNLCSADNPNQYPDNFGECSDWVELYNPTAVPYDLTGHYMTDRINNLTKWPFPAGASIPANGFRRVWMSARPETPFDNNNLHTNFRISQTSPNELVALVAPDGTTIMDVNYIESPLQLGHSLGRLPDGADNWVIFTTPTMGASNGGASYTSYVPTPEFNQEAGYHGAPFALTISCADPAAEIRYTTNGTFPTQASALYTGPIQVTETQVVMARAYSADAQFLPSYMEFSTFFLGADQHTVLIFSVSGDQVPTLLNGTQIEPLSALEMFDASGQRLSKNFGDTNKHGNDSWAYAQRGIDWIDRDKMGYSGATHEEIFSISDRDEFKAYMFKAAANDNYQSSGGAHIRDSYVQSLSQVGGLELDERSHESCVLYINGEYWGVYDVREKVDDWRYTDYYYGQGKYDIDFLKTWGGTWAEYGNDADWVTLRNFVLTNDMTDAANYEYVKSQLEVISMMDYFIINTWVVASDWLNWNTAWWKGNNPDGTARKWRYILWDMDAVFGHYINYTGIPNTGSDADPCFAEYLGDPGGQGHVPMWNALLENEDFRSLYINRYADLLNSTLSCDFAIAHLDSLIAIIEPEMQRHCDRWGGTYAGWQNNVQELRDYILDRCGDEIVDLMEDCYDLEAITVTILIEGFGSVQLNTITITEDMVPWTGTYYAGIPIDLSGIPGLGVSFINWEVIDGTIVLTDPDNPNITITPDGNITIVANFNPPIPPVPVVFMVQPEDGGHMFSDGSVLEPYPSLALIQVGEVLNLEALPNPWFNFLNWSAQNNTFDGPLDELLNTITIQAGDTIVAHFDPIIRHEVVVMVEPPESGTVQRDFTQLYPLPWSGLLEQGVDFTFRANEEPFWYFDRWESLNHEIPNAGESSVFEIDFTAPDTLVAHFVQEPFNVYIPNSFTPNNDGKNDVFLPIGSAWLPDTYELIVFNRWGEVVFQSTDPTEPWDGSHQNGQYYVSDEIYVYKMRVQSAHDIEPMEYSGHIMVFR